MMGAHYGVEGVNLRNHRKVATSALKVCGALSHANPIFFAEEVVKLLNLQAV